MLDDPFLRRVRVEKYFLEYQQLPQEEKEVHQLVLMMCIVCALSAPVIDKPAPGPAANYRLQ